MDCVILVGGFGKRLATVVPDCPKPLAEINGVPFLDLLLHQLAQFIAIEKVILAIGYLGHQIIQRYQRHQFPYQIGFSIEQTPLGTGGAIQKALQQTNSSPVLVMNGDSYLQFDLESMLLNHLETNADLTLLYREVTDASRYGTLQIETGKKRILAFQEKAPGSGLVNAGVYLMHPSFLRNLVFGEAYSFETEALPSLLSKRVFGYPCQGLFIDIGTPQSFLEAQTILKPLTVQL